MSKTSQKGKKGFTVAEIENELKARTSKFSKEDWVALMVSSAKARMGIRCDFDAGYYARQEKQYAKVQQIIDDSFWTAKNDEIDEISDIKLGRQAQITWKKLKPFYRSELIRPPTFLKLIINLTKEIRDDVKSDDGKYRIEPASWSNEKTTGLILQPYVDNIFLKSAFDSELKKISELEALAKSKDLPGPYLDSGYQLSIGKTSLQKMYKENLTSGHHKFCKNSQKVKTY